MKKTELLLVIFLSFLFFSCASKPESNNADQSFMPESPEFADEIKTTDSEKTLENQAISEFITDISNQDENLLNETKENPVNDTFIEENQKTDSVEDEADNAEKTEISESTETYENSDSTVNNQAADFFPEPEELIEPEVFELELPEAPEEVIEIVPEEISPQELIEIQPDDEVPEITETDDVLIVDLTDEDEVETLDFNSDDVIIEITEEESPIEELICEEEKIIEPSRSITMKKLEYLDVTYPGKGWIFMGLTDNSKDITYFGRKIQTNDTKFSLQAKMEGTKILHFYKEDALTGDYIDDYIEVIVENDKGSNKTHIEAPKYFPQIKKQKPVAKAENKEETSGKDSVAEKIETSEKIIQSQKENKQNINVAQKDYNESASVNQQTQPAVEEKNKTIKNSETYQAEKNTQNNDKVQIQQENHEETEEQLPDANKLYNSALNHFENEQYEAAEQELNLALQFSTNNKDKILYLMGQLYEKESVVQNINKAIDAYNTLISKYPASSLWDKANKRIIYLKRFYMEGR